MSYDTTIKKKVDSASDTDGLSVPILYKMIILGPSNFKGLQQ